MAFRSNINTDGIYVTDFINGPTYNRANPMTNWIGIYFGYVPYLFWGVMPLNTSRNPELKWDP